MKTDFSIKPICPISQKPKHILNCARCKYFDDLKKCRYSERKH